MKASPALTSFNAGLLSPLLGGRPDLEKWAAGLARCDNMIPRVQGALERAAGSVFVGSVKDSGERVWLMPFVFSQLDAFVLEFGPLYIRFYRSRGRLVTGAVTAWDSGTAYAVGDLVSESGAIYYATAASTNQIPPDGDYWAPLADDTYEIPTPYTAGDLTRPDGSFGVRFEQSGDLVYMACAGHPPKKLVRNSNLRWTIETLVLDGGPFQDQNLVKTTTVTATGTLTEGGAVTVTANAPIFLPGHVGGLMEIELEDGADVKAWQTRTGVDVGDQRRAGFKFYECTQIGPVDTGDKPAICGEEIPVHTRGKYWDGTGEEQKGDGAVGSIGAEWEYLHAGYGWLEITAYTSATEVSGIVKSRLPAELATTATYRWSLPAWSDVDGWPDNVCFFKERLTFTRGQGVWHSVSGDFQDFKAELYGEVRPDSATIVSIQSAQGNPIEWVSPTRDFLFIGTSGAEHTLGPQTTQIPYGPGNAQQAPETAWGGKGIDPVVVGAGPVFVEKSGRRLRMMVAGQEGYDAIDLNKYAGLLPAPVVSMVWEQAPHEVVWVALADGGLRGLTLKDEDKVMGWHRHDLAGGLVEALAVIPSPDGTRDDLWMVVKRSVGGVDVRYVEYRAAEYEAGADRALAVYTASSLTYDGAPTTSLAGAGHLEGKTVSILADGAAHPDRVVTDGTVALDRPASKAVLGLSMPYYAKLMPLEAGGTTGTSQAKVKRVHSLAVRLLDSLGGRIGHDFGLTDPLQYRGHGDAMDAPPPLFTGDKKIGFRGDYDGAATIAVEGNDCFPFTVIALFPEVVTYDG